MFCAWTDRLVGIKMEEWIDGSMSIDSLVNVWVDEYIGG